MTGRLAGCSFSKTANDSVIVRAIRGRGRGGGGLIVLTTLLVSSLIVFVENIENERRNITSPAPLQTAVVACFYVELFLFYLFVEVPRSDDFLMASGAARTLYRINSSCLPGGSVVCGWAS